METVKNVNPQRQLSPHLVPEISEESAHPANRRRPQETPLEKSEGTRRRNCQHRSHARPRASLRESKPHCGTTMARQSIQRLHLTRTSSDAHDASHTPSNTLDAQLLLRERRTHQRGHHQKIY